MTVTRGALEHDYREYNRTDLEYNLGPQLHRQVSISRKYVNEICNCPGFLNDGKAIMAIAGVCF